MAEKDYINEEEREALNREEFARLQMSEDVQFCLENPGPRRILRFILGPQVTNFFGHNCEERTAGVNLVNELMAHDQKAIQKLFASKENDEHGWT